MNIPAPDGLQHKFIGQTRGALKEEELMKTYLKIILVAALVCFFATGFFAYKNKVSNNGITEVANNFYTCLTIGEYDKAGKLSTGKIMDLIAKNNLDTGYTVNTISTDVLASSDFWAQTYSEIEILSGNTNTVSMEFWESSLINISDGWKVADSKQVIPQIRRSYRSINQSSIKELQSAFKDYFKLQLTSATGTYAVPDQNIDFDALNVAIKPLFLNNKCVVAQCVYQYNQRNIDLVVTFWRTTAGWQVIDNYTRSFSSN